VGIGRAASTGERHKARRGNRLDLGEVLKIIWGLYCTVNNMERESSGPGLMGSAELQLEEMF